MITGVAFLAADRDAKRAELLAQAISHAGKLGLLFWQYGEEERIAPVRATSEALGRELVVARASHRAGYQDALATLTRAGVNALVVGSSPVFSRDGAEIARLAADLRLLMVPLPGHSWGHRRGSMSFTLTGRDEESGIRVAIMASRCLPLAWGVACTRRNRHERWRVLAAQSRGPHLAVTTVASPSRGHEALPDQALRMRIRRRWPPTDPMKDAGGADES
jgi:hypothetical protein